MQVINQSNQIIGNKLNPNNKPIQLKPIQVDDIINPNLPKQMREGIFKPRLDGYNNMSANLISKIGDLQIKKMWIYRTPLNKWLQRFLALISKGVSKIEHDTLFHVGLVVLLSNGKKYIIEKLEDVTIQEERKDYLNGAQYMEVPMRGKKITMMQLLNNARNAVGDAKFFAYRVFYNNCQYFIGYLLYNSGFMTKPLYKFLFQDLKTIIACTPEWAKNTADFATTAMAGISKLRGKGGDDGRDEDVYENSSSDEDENFDESRVSLLDLANRAEDIAWRSSEKDRNIIISYLQSILNNYSNKPDNYKIEGDENITIGRLKYIISIFEKKLQKKRLKKKNKGSGKIKGGCMECGGTCGNKK